MTEYKYLEVESHDEGRIARILLNREKSRNAQNRGLLVELDDAFLAAEADDKVRVVILGGNGPMFSSGHDLGSKEALEERTPGPDQHPTFSINGGTRKGPRAACSRSGTTSSRTRCGGGTCARSPSPRSTARCTPPG